MNNVRLADYAGFCFGVKRAVELTDLWLKKHGESFCLGDLVHNKRLVEEYKNKGLTPVYENDAIIALSNENIVIRAHGIDVNLMRTLESQGNNICDTTCPLVCRVYEFVEDAVKKGRQVIIVGDENHPEIIGIKSRGQNNTCVINSEEEANDIFLQDAVTLVSQTTNIPNYYHKISNIIKLRQPNTEIIDTICQATNQRQTACAEVASNVDAMVVIGGLHSSNTSKLAKVASEYNNNVFHVESINDIDNKKLKKFTTIGITAGASTPDWIIKEAISQMENLNNNEMMEAIESSFTRIHKGDIVKGEVIFVTDSEVMVNINYRSDGIIAHDELSSDPTVKPADLFKPGDEIEVFVIKIDDGDGNVVLSTKRVESMKNWDVVAERFEKEEEFEVQIQNVVKGGLTCTVDSLNAFMPASHVSAQFVKNLDQFKGQTMMVKIIDFDKSKRRIIVSRKVVEMKEIESKRKEAYANLKEGEVVKGIVQRLTNFGAFVDLNGVDGLIHISEISWNRVKHPKEVVSPGDEVDVYIISVDEEKNRIALGLKQTTEEPWAHFTRTVKVGDVVKGKIVNLLDFGAFVRLDSGVDGLLHVSQISRDHVEKPSDCFSIGDEVEVKVTDINMDDRKISLSIRALTEEVKKEEPKEKVKVEKKPEPKEDIVDSYSSDDGFNTTIGDIFNLNNK
ncbi:MAG: bifunctional 4-hydroxy-3-methylbut-2-enyl diphosphate reductase/30S ribosomal protein S1 [Tissierellia bacterium]|nr:bifunctional 4-hydroxy-3-methylbut-2-enyl diphosphate reductase/30S ribosomal protein S1 [Tissierellia bacterium]